jgi:hypothetical protein
MNFEIAPSDMRSGRHGELVLEIDNYYGEQ